MYKIKIVAYEGNQGRYESFNSFIFYDEAEAIAEANRLKKLTGKCYGVFGDDKGKVHDTSQYYANHNLPEWQ